MKEDLLPQGIFVLIIDFLWYIAFNSGASDLEMLAMYLSFPVLVLNLPFFCAIILLIIEWLEG